VSAVALAVASVVLAAAARAQAPVVLRGRVIDASTGAPLAGAEVRVRGGTEGIARSEPNGTWRISVMPAARYTVEVRHVGHAPRTVTLPAAAWGGPGGEGAGGTGGTQEGRTTQRRQEGQEGREGREGRAGQARVRDGVELALTPVPVALDAVVVTASRRPERAKDAPVPTRVISRSDLERTGASDVGSVLAEQVGVLPTSGHPVGAGVMLQGLDAQRVLVLVDGQPVTGRIAGTFDLSRLPASMVERVEIVEGPQSTLYGSDAMGGVINIITRRVPSAGAQAELGALGGTQGRRDVWAEGSGRVGGSVGYVAELGRRAVELAPGLDEEGGAYARRWDGLATLRWAAESTFALEASALVVDEAQRWRTGQLYYFASNRQAGSRVGAVWERGGERLAPTLSLSEYRHTPRRGTSPTPPTGAGGLERQRRMAADLLYASGAPSRRVDAGVQLVREEIRASDVRAHDRALWTAEPFVQATLGLGAVRLVPGVRLSWNEQWGTHWTPRLATLWRPVPPLALRASIGAGFRAPDFKELYLAWVNDVPGSPYAVRGNPALRPETSRNLTASAEWAGEHFSAHVQVYENRVADFIETRLVGDSSGFAVYTYDNIDRARTRGVELDVTVIAGGVQLDGGYGYLDAVWRSTGEPLLGRPRHSARLGLAYTTPLGQRLSLTGLFTGRAPVARGADSVTARFQSAFTRLDARLVQPLPRGLELVLGADNLFDTRPRGWPGASRRHVYAGVRWRLLRGSASRVNADGDGSPAEGEYEGAPARPTDPERVPPADARAPARSGSPPTT
jgi:outer membrane receptor for ferrienterochelin and colicins